MRRASTTLLTSSANHGPRLYEHPAGGPWSAATALPGDPKGVAGPVVDAAGNGALGIAWRVDVPRHYSAIDVAMRDPGGTLGPPVQVAGPEAGGVRHPALAIDRAGDALLAYHVATSATHLNRGGGIAIARRSAGGAFSQPTVVDRAASSAPAVALGPDGTGIVAWTHDHGVYAVSVDAGGRLGKVKRIASPGSVTSLVAAAGREGAATLAWIGHHAVGKGRTARTSRDVHAIARDGGAHLRGGRHRRLDDRLRALGQHRGRRGRPGDAGLEPGALRRRSFDRHQRRHERGARHHARRPASASRPRGRSPRAAASTARSWP